MKEKFDLNDIYYQDRITIDEEELIKDFYNSNIDFWRDDIIKFDDHYGTFNIDNAKELIIWVSDLHDNKISFSFCFVMKDNSEVYLNINFDDMKKWLEKHDLIID